MRPPPLPTSGPLPGALRSPRSTTTPTTTGFSCIQAQIWVGTYADARPDPDDDRLYDTITRPTSLEPGLVPSGLLMPKEGVNLLHATETDLPVTWVIKCPCYYGFMAQKEHTSHNRRGQFIHLHYAIEHYVPYTITAPTKA